MSAVEHRRTTGHASPVMHVALRADGRRLASCSYDGRVFVWETSARADLSALTSLRHGRRVIAADWNPAATDVLATASAERTAAVWRIVDDRPPLRLAVLRLPAGDVRSVIWTADGQRLVCLTADGDVTLWDSSSATLISRIGRRRAQCVMVSVSSRGSVATVSDDNVIAVGDLSPHRPFGLRRYASALGACAWSPSGSILAVVCHDGSIDLLTAELELIAALRVPAAAVRSVAWIGGDQQLLVGACDGSVHLVDRTGRRLWHSRNAGLWPMSMSAAGGLVAVGSLLGVPHLLRQTPE